MRWMQTCALVVAASTATAGCAVSRNQKVALGGAASTIAGTIVLATDETDTMPPIRGQDSVGLATPVGGVFVLGGLIVMFAAAAMEEKLHEPKPLVITLADRSRVDVQARGHAWQLSKAAFIAARHGNCSKVQELSQQIRELDWDMHLTVFLRDKAVQKCVSASELEDLPPERVEPGDPDEPPPDESYEELPPPGQ